MKRTFLFAASALAAGIMLGAGESAAGIAAACMGLLAVLLFLFTKKEYAKIALCTVLVFAGFFEICAVKSAAVKDWTAFDGKNVNIKGRVINVHDEGSYAYFDLKADSISDGETEFKNKKIRVYKYDGMPQVRYGDMAEFAANIQKVRHESEMYYLSKSIEFNAVTHTDTFVLHGRVLHKFSPKDNAVLLHDRLKNIIYSKFGGSAAGFLAGILCGDKSKMTEASYSSFKICGIAHIVAVSGMHISILLGILQGIFGVFGFKKTKAAFVIYLAAVWFFVLMTGANASAVRSALGFTVMIAALFLKRDTDMLNSLAIAAFVMLAANPAILFDLGFRLSVLSMAGIAVFADKIAKKLCFLPAALSSVIAATLSAQIFTLPQIITVFGTAPLLAAAANIVVCPVMPFMLCTEILFVIFGSIPVLGGILYKLLSALTYGILYTADIFASAPAAYVSAEGAGAFLAALLLIAVLYAFLSGRKNVCKVCCCAVVGIIAALVVLNTANPKIRAAFLDVGHGDCFVLSAPHECIMIDGGGKDGAGVADDTIIPYMSEKGIKRISAAFVTHYHSDHAKGISELLRNGKIERLVLPVGIYENDLAKELAAAANAAGVPLYCIRGGETLELGEITVKAFSVYDGSEENNGMVYRAESMGKKFLVTGDITAEAETRLCEDEDVTADVLKIAHHGSKTSFNPGFISSVGPRAAVISGNGSVLSEQVYESVKLLSAEVFNTDECGTVEFIADRNGFCGVKRERSGEDEL
mgnify:FL=1